jgi:hypothetical protein
MGQQINGTGDAGSAAPWKMGRGCFRISALLTHIREEYVIQLSPSPGLQTQSLLQCMVWILLLA